jgi:glycosyltransferase involved in cell wall biosynthesis
MTPHSDTRSLLFVAQLSPPVLFSAAQRVAGLTKYLSRIGCQVTVLTSLASGSGPVPNAAYTVRTRDLIVSRLNPRREHYDSVRGGSESSYEERASRLAALFVPDLALAGWVPFALPRALALTREQRFDCVISTSPPESAHFIGATLKRLRGLAWIADFRDGWGYETNHPDWPLSVQHRLDGALERAIARDADLAVGVTDALADDLRSRVGARAATITNGFDPEERVSAAKADVGLRPERYSLVHTGRIGFTERSPRPIIDALKRLKKRAPAAAARLELVLAGPLSASERDLINARSLDGAVRSLGTLDRHEMLALQSAADALLLIVTPTRMRTQVPAKLYEYMATGRPVLVLGEESTAARMVRENGAGFVTSATDPEAISHALERLVAGGTEEGADAGKLVAPDGIERYSYPRIAAQYAEQIERILELRAR